MDNNSKDKDSKQQQEEEEEKIANHYPSDLQVKMFFQAYQQEGKEGIGKLLEAMKQKRQR